MKELRDHEHPAVTQALRALKARKGPATDDDRPSRHSRSPYVIDGQLSIYDVIDTGQEPGKGDNIDDA